MNYALVPCVSNFRTPYDLPDTDTHIDEQAREEMKNLTVDRYSDALFVAGSEYKTASLVVGLLNGENTVEDLRESVSEDMKTLIKQEMKERS
jgi:hypothetical protein